MVNAIGKSVFFVSALASETPLSCRELAAGLKVSVPTINNIKKETNEGLDLDEIRDSAQKKSKLSIPLSRTRN